MKRHVGRVLKIWNEVRPDISKIRDFVGFEPTYDLEAIIESVIDYFKE